MNTDHFSRCKADVLAHTDGLIARVKAGFLNEAAFERLMKSYLDSPAVYPEWREILLNVALNRLDGLDAETRRTRRGY